MNYHHYKASDTKTNMIFLIFCSYILVASCSKVVKNDSNSSSSSAKIGAYYFDGWTERSAYLLTDDLIHGFPERESIWGWITSKQEILNAQIDVAANNGISFFSFCWYYEEGHLGGIPNGKGNDALAFYLSAPNSKRLGFNLLVANHSGFLIGPAQWDAASTYWVSLFKNPSYLQVNGKPLLTFFSLNTLIESFGSTKAVKSAFDKLRSLSIKEGLKGVSIAVCITPDSVLIKQANECGFDVLTGYNYHSAGLQPNEQVIAIDSLSARSARIWNQFLTSGIPYIPVATLNWDPRPWVAIDSALISSPRYTGYSSSSVYNSVIELRKWLKTNPTHTTKERIALMYAWNEYGEGAWLTPGKTGFNVLGGVKQASLQK